MDDFTRRLPCELLWRCLDFVALLDLTRVMATSRRWQHVAITHETYWKYITVSSTSPAAAEWFSLRLSRSGFRMISVEAKLMNAEECGLYAITCAISAHLSHIQSLTCWIDFAYSTWLFDALSYPAPHLEDVALLVLVDDPDRPSIPPIPSTLFQAFAPQLLRFAAQNVSLGEIPHGAFPSVTILECGLNARYDLLDVQAAFGSFGPLRELTLFGYPRVKDVKAIEPSAWDKFHLISFVLGSTIPDDVASVLQLYRIPHVACSGPTESDALAVLAGADGPLQLHVQPDRRFDEMFFMHVIDPATLRLRSFTEKIRAKDEEHIPYSVAACGAIMDRITFMSLPTSLWTIVLSNVTVMPNLVELRIVLVCRSEPLAACSQHRPILTKLGNLTLRAAHDAMRLRVDQVVSFLHTLNCAELRVDLRLEGVVLDGDAAALPGVTQRLIYGDLQSSTYPIDQSGLVV